MLIKNAYQTVPLPDGTFVKGLFPTDRWFNAISRYIDWKDKTILDLGCCNFSYGIQALNHEAKYVMGVENDSLRIQQIQEIIDEWNYCSKSSLVNGSIEDFHENTGFDISIFSMIIHWLKNPEKHIRRIWNMTNKHMVLIYRYPNIGLAEPGYRPTVVDLNKLLDCEPVADTMLSETQEQNIRMLIYDKSF